MKDERINRFPERKRNRLLNYDYSSCNYYFLTICSKNNKCIFGKPGDLNHFGSIVQSHIIKLQSYYNGITVDKFVVMPNHVHLIIRHDGKDDPDIPQIMALFKTGVTKEIRKSNPGMNVWQRSYHDHIIRSQSSYEKIWLYIHSNPQNWSKDRFYIETE